MVYFIFHHRRVWLMDIRFLYEYTHPPYVYKHKSFHSIIWSCFLSGSGILQGKAVLLGECRTAGKTCSDPCKRCSATFLCQVEGWMEGSCCSSEKVIYFSLHAQVKLIGSESSLFPDLCFLCRHSGTVQCLRPRAAMQLTGNSSSLQGWREFILALVSS